MRALLFLALVFGTSLMPQEGPFQRFTAVAWPAGAELFYIEVTRLDAGGDYVVNVFFQGAVTDYDAGLIQWTEVAGAARSDSIVNIYSSATSYVTGCGSVGTIATPSGYTVLTSANLWVGPGAPSVPSITGLTLTGGGGLSIPLTAQCSSASRVGYTSP